jgi:hypothetical protein
MGGPPLNKLYSILMTLYACVKTAEARAYHHRLSGFVSPFVNNILILAAIVSFIFGPCIGYWDCYYDMPMHMKVTGLFTGGEIVYIYGVVYLIATNRDQFDASATQAINLCVLALTIVAIDGILMFCYGPEELGIAIHQIGEWVAFYLDFFVRYQLSTFMRYNAVVRPKQE